MNRNQKLIFDNWFNELKDVEIIVNGKPFLKVKGILDRAFLSGYKDGENKNRYKNTLIEPVYKAGIAVKKHQNRRKNELQQRHCNSQSNCLR